MHLVVIKQDADGFTMVDAPDRLGKDGRDIQNIQLGSKKRLVLVLRHRVGHNHLVDGRCLYAVDSVTAEDAVGQKGVDLGRTLLFAELGSACNGVARIEKVVDENADAVPHITHQHHACVLPVRDLSRAAFLF